MAFITTPAHAAIFNRIQDPDGGNLVVEAVAGAGKTSTIVEALKLIPPEKKVVFLAFNTSIVQELKTRVPSHVDVMTLNGLGWRAYLAHAKAQGFSCKDPDTKKTLTIARDCLSTADMARIGTDACKLVSKAKASGLLPDGIEWAVQGLMPDTFESWVWLAQRFDVDCEDALSDTINAAQAIYKRSCAVRNVLDFDDQQLLTFGLGLKMPKFDWVFVDEAQDLSPLQHRLVERIVNGRNGSRLVAVGDPHQSIYGFRGADVDSMNKLERDFNCTKLPLHVSYRCAKAIVAEAQQSVSHIQAHQDAPDGTVERNVKVLDDCSVKPGDFILCRLSAPVVQAAYSLLRAGIPAVVRGRDIGTGLLKLLDKLKSIDLGQAEARLGAWEERELAKVKDDEAKQASIQDRAETLRLFIRMSDSLDDCRSRIEKMFSNDNPEGAVICSTVHKAKGLEADRVFLIDRDKMPHKMAKQPWQVQQEINLIYVAVTRAKKHLQFVTLSGDAALKKPKEAGKEDPWQEIGGNTYPVKDSLKALGCKWEPTKKVWMCPPNRADEARKLVGGAPAKRSAPSGRSTAATEACTLTRR